VGNGRIKTIEGHRWHPVEKHWSFNKLDGMLEKILKVFGDGDIQMDPTLQAKFPTLKGTVVPDLRTPYTSPPHRWGRSPTLHSFGDGAEREGVKKLESGLSPKYEAPLRLTDG
jgi:hypothetical protein